MSRHRRQPSRALPLDFNVDDDEGSAGAAKGDGSQKPAGAGSGGVRGDHAARGPEGHTSKKPPPPTGSRSSAEGAAQHKSQADAPTGAGGR